jgi:hypothetical protein
MMYLKQHLEIVLILLQPHILFITNPMILLQFIEIHSQSRLQILAIHQLWNIQLQGQGFKAECLSRRRIRWSNINCILLLLWRMLLFRSILLLRRDILLLHRGVLLLHSGILLLRRGIHLLELILLLRGNRLLMYLDAIPRYCSGLVVLIPANAEEYQIEQQIDYRYVLKI